MKRRQILTALFATAVIAVVGGIDGSNIAAAQSKTVVFAGMSGSMQRTQRQVFFDAFEKETGIKVIDVPDVQLGKIKLMVETVGRRAGARAALGVLFVEVQ